MGEAWQDKDCSATNTRWNLDEQAAWEMISWGLTAEEMLLTSRIVMVNNKIINCMHHI